MFTAAVITLSDKAAAGMRKDESGPAAVKIMQRDKLFDVKETVIIPDNPQLLKNILIKMCDEKKYNLVLTTGGTGLSPRDFTPEATMEIADRMVPGIAEYMRAKSMEITPRAMLSRGVAVVRKETLIINLPGSPKAVAENLEAILAALPHGLEIMTGKASDCGHQTAFK